MDLKGKRLERKISSGARLDAVVSEDESDRIHAALPGLGHIHRSLVATVERTPTSTASNFVAIYDDGERSAGWDEILEVKPVAPGPPGQRVVDAVVDNPNRRMARDFDETSQSPRARVLMHTPMRTVRTTCPIQCRQRSKLSSRPGNTRRRT